MAAAAVGSTAVAGSWSSFGRGVHLISADSDCLQRGKQKREREAVDKCETIDQLDKRRGGGGGREA